MSETARPKFCPECGVRLHGDERFCGGCGHALMTGAPHIADASAPEPLAQPTQTVPQGRGLRCVECSSPIGSGLVCARCAKGRAQDASVPATPTDMPPSSPRRQGSTPAARKRNPLVDWTVAFAVLSVFVITVLLVGKKDPHSKLGAIAYVVADVTKFGHGLDGTYVTSGYVPPLKITIDGDMASWDLGVARADHMKVERHGDTVSLAGGEARHADGRLFTAEELHGLEGGDDVVLLTLGDGEQTLTTHDPDAAGNRIVFTKQR